MTIRLIVKLLFVLLPVSVWCQNNNEYGALQPGSDSVIMPAFNRKWTPQEFQTVFQQIIAQQKRPIARVITLANSKALFAKITDFDNYWFLTDTVQSLNARIPNSLNLTTQLKTILMHYYQTSKKINGKLNHEKELASVYALLYYMVKNQMELAYQFAQANPDLPPKRLEGLKKMVNGANTMLSGGLITLETEYILYSEESICKISRAFHAFYTSVQAKIDAESRTEFDKRIARIKKSHPLQCVKEAL